MAVFNRLLRRLLRKAYIMTEDSPSRLKLFMAEMTGAGLLLLIGLSSVIFMFAASSIRNTSAESDTATSA